MTTSTRAVIDLPTSATLAVAPVEIRWHDDLPIFATESFLKAVGDDYGWLGGKTPSGELLWLLPYTVVHKAGVRLARFRVEPIALAGAGDADQEKQFLNGVVNWLRAKRVDMVIPATTNSIFRVCPDGAQVAPYGTYVIDLQHPEETLWRGLNESHRRKVRQATKGGIQIVEGTKYTDSAYELVRDTFKRSKMGFMSRASFEQYTQSLGDHIRILVAEHEGVAQACAVVPFSRHSAYYVYGGSVPEPRNGAAHLLHWEAIRRFRELGVRRYDFVGARINPDAGSKQDGIRMFKERFGGQLLQGYIWKLSLNPITFAFYSLAVRVLRGGDIVDQERRRFPVHSSTAE